MLVVAVKLRRTRRLPADVVKNNKMRKTLAVADKLRRTRMRRGDVRRVAAGTLGGPRVRAPLVVRAVRAILEARPGVRVTLVVRAAIRGLVGVVTSAAEAPVVTGNQGTLGVHLVQRLRREVDGTLPPEARSKFSPYFRLDYMGAAEFEFGVCDQAWDELKRAALPRPVAITCDEHVAWYVGPVALQDVAAEFFQGELSGARPGINDFCEGRVRYWLKEASYLRQTYSPRTDTERQYYRTDGWWAVDAGQTWALFRTEGDAALWWQTLEPFWPKPWRQRLQGLLGSIFKGKGPRGFI